MVFDERKVGRGNGEVLLVVIVKVGDGLSVFYDDVCDFLSDDCYWNGVEDDEEVGWEGFVVVFCCDVCILCSLICLVIRIYGDGGSLRWYLEWMKRELLFVEVEVRELLRLNGREM